MNSRKVRDLVRSVLAERDAMADPVVTWDTLSIDFPQRTVSFRGRTVEVKTDAIVFPMLNTDRLILTKDGSEVV